MTKGTIIFLVVYFLGVIANGVIATAIDSEMKEDGVSRGIRIPTLLFWVLGSVATWVYLIIYIGVNEFAIRWNAHKKLKQAKKDVEHQD